MNVIVSVECFQMLMKRKSKYPFQQRTILPKNWIRCSQVLLLSFLTVGTLDFLGSNLRPYEAAFRFPSHPSVDLFKRLPQTLVPLLFQPISPFLSHPGLHQTRLQHFSKQSKPSFHIAVVFYGWISTRDVPKISDRNIKCPSVSARACHPSCCTLLSSDERQPPNMWQGRGPCGKWFGKCSIYSVSQCLAFHTCNLQTRCPLAMFM